MKTTDYRMVAFEGDLDEVTRKFNAWASGDDGIEITNIQFVPLTFDTYANRYAVVVFYTKEVYKVQKCKPVIERPTPEKKYMREKDPLTIFDPLIDRLYEEDKND